MQPNVLKFPLKLNKANHLQTKDKTSDANVVEVSSDSVPRIECVVRVKMALKNMERKVDADDEFVESISSTQSTSTSELNSDSETTLNIGSKLQCKSGGGDSLLPPPDNRIHFLHFLPFLAVGIAAIYIVYIAIRKKDKILACACVRRKKSGNEKDSLEIENGSTKTTETV